MELGNFADTIEESKASIMADILEDIPIGRKGTNPKWLGNLVKVREEKFRWVMFDLPKHTFTPTTYFYILARIKDTAKEDLVKKLDGRHIMAIDLEGSMREALDEEVIRNEFEGKKLTKFEIILRAYTWGGI